MSNWINNPSLSRSMRRSVVALGVILLGGTLLLATPAMAKKKAVGARNKVVFQVSDNDPAKWGLTLNNVANVQSSLGTSNVDIELVVYGPGIGMLKAGSPVADRIASTVKTGAKVVACETTLAAQKLTHDDMLPTIGYVPGGVIELMQKQQQGYAYIRP